MDLILNQLRYTVLWTNDRATNDRVIELLFDLIIRQSNDRIIKGSDCLTAERTDAQTVA